MKNKNLYLLLLLIAFVIVLLPSFKPAPTSFGDYEIVSIRGKEFIKSRVSGGYVYTKIN